MSQKHQPYRRADGFWSCRVCRWQFNTRPGKDDCPGYLRIERATDNLKTEKQWKALGFVLADPFAPVAACAIVHSDTRYLYYHRSQVKEVEK